MKSFLHDIGYLVRCLFHTLGYGWQQLIEYKKSLGPRVEYHWIDVRNSVIRLTARAILPLAR